MAFYKGHIPCHDDRGEKWYFRDDHGRGKKNVLSIEAQEIFLDKVFITYEYDNLEPDQEEDLFARVQLGIPLSAAEKLRAQTGPWQTLAKMFCQDFPLIYNLQKDMMRAKDFQLTLQCFSQVIEVMTEQLNPISKTNHAHLVKLLQQPNLADENTKSHFANVWTKFSELIQAEPNTFTNDTKWLKGVQTFAPVEMIAVVVLVSVYLEEECTNDQLLNDIRVLRQTLRENFKDLRIGQLLWKEVWKHINNFRHMRRATGESTVRQNAQSHAPKSKSMQVMPAPKTDRPSLSDTAVVNKVEPSETGTDLRASRPHKRQRTESISTTPTLQTTSVTPSHPPNLPLRSTNQPEPERSQSSSVVQFNPINKVAAKKTPISSPASTAKASTSAKSYCAPAAPMGVPLNTPSAPFSPARVSSQNKATMEPLDQALHSIAPPNATESNLSISSTFKRPIAAPRRGVTSSANPSVSRPWPLNVEPLGPASPPTTAAPMTPIASPQPVTVAGPSQQRHSKPQGDCVIDLTEDGDDDDSDEDTDDGAQSEEQRVKGKSERETTEKKRSNPPPKSKPPSWSVGRLASKRKAYDIDL